MMFGNGGQGVGWRRGTGDAVVGARGISHLNLAVSGEDAQQTAVKYRQIVDDQIELSGLSCSWWCGGG